MRDINNYLLKFEKSMLDNHSPQLAKHMLVLMVRGLITLVEFPYVQYATSGASADLIFPVVWDAVQHLEVAGLHFMYTVLLAMELLQIATFSSCIAEEKSPIV